MLEKPKLFLTTKEFLLTVIVFLVFLFFRLYLLYNDYTVFKEKAFYFTKVEVLGQYKKEKKGKVYTILKVYSPDLDLTFFTRTYRDENYLYRELRLKLFPQLNMGFKAYLSSSFIPSKINRVYSSSTSNIKSLLLEKIASQHQNLMIKEFYQAIFLATPLSKELRGQVSMLGVSHLMALSGFHLGILWTVIFVLFRLPYRFLQQHYFPYRFDLIDVGLFSLVILGWYVWFVGSPASLVRSYTMMLMGWGVLVLGIELLTFTFLFTMIMVILLIFPKMLLSLAFWFSIFGVFYIFLLLESFKEVNKLMMTLLISFGLFVLMLPLVHVVFPVTSILQLYSPFLSLAFSLFYPLAIVAHLVGYGDFFDTPLLVVFSLKGESWEMGLGLFYGIVYLLLSLGAIYSRWLLYLLFSVAFGFLGFIFKMLYFY